MGIALKFVLIREIRVTLLPHTYDLGEASGVLGQRFSKFNLSASVRELLSKALRLFS